MKTMHSLKAGESLAVTGTLTIIRCGTISEGGGPDVPVVDFEVETADAAPAAAPAAEHEDEHEQA